MLRSIEARTRRLLALATIVSVGGLGLAGCDFVLKDPHVNPEASAQMATLLKPEAVRIGRVIVNAYKANNGQYFYSNDSKVPGGQEATVDFREASYNYTLTADMMTDKNGNLLPATTYSANVEGTPCTDWSCGDYTWDAQISNTDTFYSGRTEKTEHRKVWYAEEDLYAPWDTKKLIDETDTHMYDPTKPVDSKQFQKELAEAHAIKHHAEVAINAAKLDSAFGYSKVSSPKG